MTDKTEPDIENLQVKLNLRVPNGMASVYAHHMFIQPGENEVVLSFFEIIQPPLLPGQERTDRLKYMQEVGLVAECVARVTVALARFPEFAGAMQEVSTRILEIQAQEQAADKADHDSEDHSKS